jgi:hypothetical protein
MEEVSETPSSTSSNDTVNTIEVKETQDTLSSTAPTTEKVLDVILDLSSEHVKPGKIRFHGKTNLPDGMKLILSLSSDKGYYAQHKVAVSGGTFLSEWFMDASRANGSMAKGTYRFQLTSTIPHVQPVNVKGIIGKMGENMKGKLVVQDPIFGNRVSYTKEIIIE